MAIAPDVLQTLKPTAFEEARAAVRDGDLLLCQGNDGFSRLIRWATKSPWSHVAMAFRIDSLDRVLVLEAVEKIGVRCVTLEDFVSRTSEGASPYPGAILLARRKGLAGKVGEARVKALAAFGFDQLGDRFAPAEIAKIGLRILSARLFHRRRTPHLLLPKDEFICSEFVAAAFHHADLPIPWDGLGFIAPCDFADDPAVSAVLQFDVTHPPARPGVRTKESASAALRPRARRSRKV